MAATVSSDGAISECLSLFPADRANDGWCIETARERKSITFFWTVVQQKDRLVRRFY